ncbi:MAG: PIN domain-containing protein, partial [Acidobacteria bacterium]|nr:PIN domain-containing protein [Acidobacteriota bacterium]
MMVFVDTSALLAVLDADDVNHGEAREVWQALLSRDATLLCTNYVLLETFALVQRRLGLQALATLQSDVVSVLRIRWVDGAVHAAAVAALLTAGRRKLSLVDCVSFEVARRSGVEIAFAFDRQFAEQGFQCLPGSH